MRAIAFLCFALSCISAARATTFALNARLESGTLVGTVDIDTVKGLFTAANIDFSLNGQPYFFTFAPTGGQGVNTTGVFGQPSVSYYYGYFGDGAGDYLFLSLYQSTLVGFMGPAELCSDSHQCIAYAGGHASGAYSFGSYLDLHSGALGVPTDFFSSGTLTPLAATPEPATYWYVASGLGAAWIAGRKPLPRHKRLQTNT